MTPAEHDLLLLIAQRILDADKDFSFDAINARAELRRLLQAAKNEDDFIYEGKNPS